jgi:hypothetical protein
MIFRLLRRLWPFRRRLAQKPHKIPKKVIAGMVIGGAIASIVGKKLLDKHHDPDNDD